MNPKEKWVLVTRNKGKAKEFEFLFKEWDIKFLTLDDIGFTQEIPETGSSFQENAHQKVQHVIPHTDLPLISDDSGIEVEALHGAPGIYSARYAGEDATDEDNRKKLLLEMEMETNLTAHFTCVLCLRINGTTTFYHGKCRGKLSRQARGGNGFGYDSLFIPEGYEKTFGELSEEIKLSISHRSNAVKEMLLGLKKA